MRLIANVLLGFGYGGSSPATAQPATPLLQVVDNGDHQTATATVSGADVGTSNEIWVAFDSGSLTFASRATIAGNGSATLTLGPGDYVAFVISRNATYFTDSLPVAFTIAAAASGGGGGGGGGAGRGAPTICNMNSFEPFCGMKTPKGDVIIVNGIDKPRIWDGYATTAKFAGIAAPTSAPVVTHVAGGNVTGGSHACYYRFLDENGQPSSLSPVATVQADDLDQLKWTIGVSTSTDGRVTKRQLWRTTTILEDSPPEAQNVIYLVGEIDDNTTTTFTEGISDADLLSAGLADTSKTMNILNPDGTLNANRFTPPPQIKKVAVFFQNRAFYLGDVAYDKGSVSVVNGSTTVTGINAGWTDSFVGRFFYGIGAPKGYEIGSVTPADGPVTMTIAGVAPTNCVQTITFPNQPTSGTWSVSCGSASATGLSFAISAAALQTALEGLSTIGLGNVSVTGSVAAGFTVTFIGAKAATPMPLLLADGSLLKGTLTISVAEVTAGGSGNTTGGANQIERVGFAMIDKSTGGIDAAIQTGSGGTFTITNRHPTPTLTSVPVHVHAPGGPPNAGPDPAELTSALEGILGAGNVKVTMLDTLPFWGNGQIQFDVEFIGSLAGQEYLGGVGADVPLVLDPTSVINIDPTQATAKPIGYISQQGGGGNQYGGANEVQSITLPPGTAGGTWTASPSGCETGPIAWNATAAEVQAAFVAACGANYAVTGNPGGPYTVTFVGTLSGHAQPPITCVSTDLVGVQINTAMTTPGTAGVSSVQTLNLGGATGGTFTLTFGFDTTPAIPVGSSAATIQATFTALASVGAGNCTVTGSNGIFQFAFGGTLANSVQPLITCNVSQLVGYQETSTITLTEPYGGATTAPVIYCIRPAPQERNQLYYSEDGEPESVPNINTIRCQQFTNVDDEIVGAMIYGPFMYVLMSSHILSFSYGKVPGVDGSLALAAQRGVFNQRCWDYVDGTAFMMDSEGAYMFDGSTIEPISNQVEDFWRDGTIDFSKSKRFWVRASPLEELVRFGVCFANDTFPRQSLTYSYRQKAWALEVWHQEMGAAIVYPLSGRRRFLLCGQSDTIHLSGQGYADGIDSTTETGTMAGSVTGATSNTLTDSNASFTATMVGAPVAIVSGTGEGQLRTIVSQTATGFVLDSNWDTVPDPSSRYLVGAIDWTYRTGILQFTPPEPEGRGQYTPTADSQRALRVAWRPTGVPMEFAIRKYLNHNASPEENASNGDFGNGLTAVAGATDLIQQIAATRDDGAYASVKTAGFTRVEFARASEDSANVDRWVSIELSGFQAQDSLMLFALEIQGVE